MKLTQLYKEIFCKTAGMLLIGVVATSLVKRSYNYELPDPDPKRELESFHLADGFEISLFAADPLVVKPIQMNWDADGRLWVVTSTAYPHTKTGEPANDKIYVLEDTDGDGKADKSTVFAEGLVTPTGILPGDGGVYVANATEILFLKDTDGDGKADQKKVVLTGFGTADTHHLIHTFRWGPDGKLYFNQSIYIHSHVETPSGVKRLEGGGVWQLNPATLDLNVFAKGLINPWGLQFTDFGQSLLTDGAGSEGINYGFEGATFLASPGSEKIIRGLNPGQPKFSGLEIISGKHLPESMQGDLITNDFRANRISRFRLEEQGSGFVSKQLEDLLWTDNVAFRPVDISVGPDGAIYVADWYNPIIQHGEVDFFDPRRDHEHGRIWRITAKNRATVKRPKLSSASIEELLESLKADENWTRAQAKQVLKERGANAVVPALQQWRRRLEKTDKKYERHLLEAAWTMQTLDRVDESLLLQLLNANGPQARAAGLRLLRAWGNAVSNKAELLGKAVEDPHPLVRLEAVIGLKQLQNAEAARLALTVLDKPMDEYLDYALWQTLNSLEPYWLATLKSQPSFLGDERKTVFALKSTNNAYAITSLVNALKENRVPEQYKTDVLASLAKWGSAEDLRVLLHIAEDTEDGEELTKLLATLEDAATKRKLAPSGDTQKVIAFIDHEEESVSLPAIRLAGYWKLQQARHKLMTLVKEGDVDTKRAALAAAVAMDNDQAEPMLVDFASQKQPTDIRLLAAAQLVSVNAGQSARIAADLLRKLPTDTDVSELFQAFVVNKEGIPALLKEMGTKKIPVEFAKSGRITLKQKLPWTRQRDTDVEEFASWLEASGGTLPPEVLPQELSATQINEIKKEARLTGDPVNGEKIYRKTGCMPCHAIGGAGGRLGPDLSSLGPSSPAETIIKSIIAPNESIKEGYELQRVVKNDETEVMGYLAADGNTEIKLREMDGHELAIPKNQIAKIEKIPGSLMPPGLTAHLSKKEFVDLISFLTNLGQPGAFRVPSERYVRYWQAVSAAAEVNKKLREQGTAAFRKEDKKITTQSAYSKVSGDLPLDELPVIDGGQNKKYSVVKFKVDVLTRGAVQLLFNSTAGISGFEGGKPLKVNDKGALMQLDPGVKEVTVIIDRSVRKEGDLKIEVKETASDAAQFKVLMN